MTPDRVAWDWVDHLRAGGTTPWREFRDARPVDPGPGLPDAGRGRLPGAAQLELVRRLAVRAARRPALDLYVLGGLLDRALDRSGPGRGPAELPLDLTGGSRPRTRAPRIGPPPTDPGDVDAAELVRVGVGLLVDELLRDPGPAPVQPDAGRRRPWSRQFWLAGAPATAAVTRAALADAGHVAGGRSPEVVLVAGPLEELLGEVWSARVQRGAPVSWQHFVRRWARQDGLPPSADLPALAATWAERVGAARVHVVLGPDVRRRTADVLGLPDRRRVTAPSMPGVLALPAAGTDLLRRVNEVLAVRLPQERRHEPLRVAAGVLPRPPAAHARPALAVPARHRQWVERQAARIVEELRLGGYPVHGDLDQVAVRTGGPGRPRPAEVLDLLLDSVLRVAERAA